MSTIKPFEDAGGFTVFRNIILDRIMPECKPNTWKVICSVMRKTLGWHKENDRISFTQFQELTGIKHRNTLKAALEDALEMGFIKREQKGNSFVYSLNRDFELENGAEIAPISEEEILTVSENWCENRTKIGAKIEGTKDKRKTSNIVSEQSSLTGENGNGRKPAYTAPPIPQADYTPPPIPETNPKLAKYPVLKRYKKANGDLLFAFWEATGIKPIERDYMRDMKTTNEMIERGITPNIVEKAIQKLRQERLVVSGPHSIMKVAISIQASDKTTEWNQEEYEQNKARLQAERRRMKAEKEQAKEMEKQNVNDG